MTLPPLTNLAATMDPAAVQAAESAVREFCRWHIAPEVTTTLRFDGHQGQELMLPTLLLTDVVAVSIDGVALDPLPDWSETGYLSRWNWCAKLRGIEVTFKHGHAACPADVKQLVATMARDAADGRPVSSARLGSRQETYEISVYDLQAATLAPYVKPSRP